MALRSSFMIAAIWFLALGPGASPSLGETIRVSKQACANVVRHTPAPDVAYKPGVDVYGRKVTPADLGSPSPIKVPDVISFDLKLNLPGLSPSAGSIGTSFGEPVLGKISIQGNQVYFNGQPLGGIGQSELIKKCRKALSGKR